MKILLSPAKSLNEDCPISRTDYTLPALINKTEVLAANLKRQNVDDIKLLMKLSLSLAELNYQRFQSWNTPFNTKNASPCGWVFNGDAYKGLDYASLNDDDIAFSQKSLRILSGFYGILRPLDLIQAYRLEMGTRLQISNDVKNLYSFWGDQITDLINNEIVGNEVIVNLASNEYFKAINTKKLKGKLVQCSFKEDRGGELKMIMSFAKKARGLMSRYIIQNKIEDQEDLMGFNEEGYSYRPKLSTTSEYVYVR
jgi:hypothetical protein